MKHHLIFALVPIIAATAQAQLNELHGPTLMIGSLDGGSTNNATNFATVGTAGVTMFYGNGANLTGVSGSGGGISGTNGISYLQSLSQPTLTNATLSPSNTSTAVTLTNSVLANGLYADWLGGTNSLLERMFLGGTEYWDFGIWDATNKTWSVRNAAAGWSGLSISNGNGSAVFKGDIYTGTNLHIPTSGGIYFGANSVISAYGTQNFFGGGGVGNATMVGVGNTALGATSFQSNTTGCYNSTDGALALQNNTSGSYNVAVGATALNANTTGSNNTAVGTVSLSLNTTGQNNIAIGSSSGALLTTGNNNIDIGNYGNAGESGIIRIGDPNFQTDAYVAGTLHAVAYGPVLAHFTNTFIPGDVAVQLDGQPGYGDDMNFFFGGNQAWQFRATTNAFSVVDTNGAAAVTVTNGTDSVFVRGGVFASNFIGGASGLTSVPSYVITNNPSGDVTFPRSITTPRSALNFFQGQSTFADTAPSSAVVQFTNGTFYNSDQTENYNSQDFYWGSNKILTIDQNGLTLGTNNAITNWPAASTLTGNLTTTNVFDTYYGSMLFSNVNAANTGHWLLANDDTITYWNQGYSTNTFKADGWVFKTANGISTLGIVGLSITGSAIISSNIIADSATLTNGITSLASNLVAPTSFSISSGVNWTNPLNVNIEVYLDMTGTSGNSPLTKNGVQIFLLGGPSKLSFHLQKGEYFALTPGSGTLTYNPRYSPE